MIITDKMFYPELIDVYDGESALDTLVDYAANRLAELGFIETTYQKALKEREREYPTGLQTPSLAVAIPHTDPSHIKQPFIYIIKLANPVTFGQMGTTDEFVSAKYAFFLGFDKGEDQLQLLQKLMAMFMDETVMLRLEKEVDKKEILTLVTQFFKAEREK
ncbi:MULTISPECIES: PTS sugar transporter subunit IIA [Enterococcus]|uniref:PTS sugar transporter subunit IIA n=1 Tax=Candidatus Enterococcus murrayae TaxID=2815321 RepID=A0ABS3HIM5_9ENTE|nr:PTS sugar transporter subunit IIA [Enterococcus sp. MJM16]MBO0453316.1 PTS sugar transporter subunit IIA [Enterococcus sp. MJM16]